MGSDEMTMDEFLKILADKVAEEEEKSKEVDKINPRAVALELLKMFKEEQNLDANENENKEVEERQERQEKKQEDVINKYEEFHKKCEIAQEDVAELVACTTAAALSIGMAVGFHGMELDAHMAAVSKGIARSVDSIDWGYLAEHEDLALEFFDKALNR